MHVKLTTENRKVPFPLVESEKWKEPYASPFCSMTDGGAEFEPSKCITCTEKIANNLKYFLDVKGDAKDDYKFVVQLYNPSDITKGTENIDKE